MKVALDALMDVTVEHAAASVATVAAMGRGKARSDGEKEVVEGHGGAHPRGA